MERVNRKRKGADKKPNKNKLFGSAFDPLLFIEERFAGILWELRKQEIHDHVGRAIMEVEIERFGVGNLRVMANSLEEFLPTRRFPFFRAGAEAIAFPISDAREPKILLVDVVAKRRGADGGERQRKMFAFCRNEIGAVERNFGGKNIVDLARQHLIAIPEREGEEIFFFFLHRLDLFLLLGEILRQSLFLLKLLFKGFTLLLNQFLIVEVIDAERSTYPGQGFTGFLLRLC
jgi:hypothetical protein